MSRLSISSSFLVYCHLRCSLDGILLNLVKYNAKYPSSARIRAFVYDYVINHEIILVSTSATCFYSWHLTRKVKNDTPPPEGRHLRTSLSLLLSLRHTGRTLHRYHAWVCGFRIWCDITRILLHLVTYSKY